MPLFNILLYARAIAIRSYITILNSLFIFNTIISICYLFHSYIHNILRESECFGVWMNGMEWNVWCTTSYQNRMMWWMKWRKEPRVVVYIGHNRYHVIFTFIIQIERIYIHLIALFIPFRVRRDIANGYERRV